MKILVTGANGYIGRGIVSQLVKDGMDVITTDLSEKRNMVCAKYIVADIFEVDNPYEFFDKPDIVLHLAWRDGFKHSSKAHIEDLEKHYGFIQKMITGGIRQVCILGSVHEVGFFEGCVDENTPCNPQSLYGICKNALRSATMLLAKENNVCFQWIRGYYIVGNTHMGCSIFSKITQSAEKGEKKFPFTNGTNQFDFIDYDTFCYQVASTVEQTHINGIINCCSGYPEKIGERVEKFIAEQKYNIQLEYGKFPDRPYDSKAIWGNNKKIMKILHERETK